MIQYKLTTLSIIILFFIWGCAHFKTDFYSYPKTSEKDVLNFSISNSTLIKSFESSTIARIASPQINMAARMIFYYDDNKIRIETMTPFGNPISSFLFNQNKIEFYDISNNMFIIGENKPEHFAKLIQIPLNAEELKLLIKCNIPYKIKNNVFYVKNNTHFFEAEDSRFSWGTITLNEKQLINEIKLHNQKQTLSVKYLNYKFHNEIYYPERITIETDNNSVTLNIRSIEFKNQIEESIFTLSPNKNAIRIYLND